MRRVLGFWFVVLPIVRGGDVCISEVMPDDATVLADEDGEYPGWVEFENRGDAPASLANHGLSDEVAQPFKWRFPAVVLQPGQRLLVFTSGKDRRGLPISDLTPSAAPPDWHPWALPGLSLWLDAADLASIVAEDGRVERWKDRTGRPYPADSLPAMAPAEVPGLVLWLDGADATTMQWEGDRLRTWEDKSGQRNHATQPALGSRPSRFGLADGRPPRLRFDGIDDYLRMPRVTNVLTLVWVAHEDLLAAEPATLLGDVEGRAYLPGERRALLNSNRAPGRRTWLDGVEVPPYTTRTPNRLVVTTITAGMGATLSLLGSDRLRAGGYWVGELGEVLLFSRVLSNGERAGVEQCLRAKWKPEEPLRPAGYDAVQELGTSRPLRVTDALTGLPGIRFDGEDDWMRFPRLEDVLTIAWVGRERPGSRAGNPAILGDTIRYDLLRGDGGKIYQYCSVAWPVRNGQTWLDAVKIDPVLTPLPPRRVQLCTVATSAITLGILGSDRLLDGYFWAGDLHEVLFFNRRLSAGERTQLETYLAAKWRLPERHLHTGFKLASSGEWLVLSNPQGIALDALPPVVVPRDVSYVREDRDGPAGFGAEPTPGRANTTPRYAGITPVPLLDPPGGFVPAPMAVSVTPPPDASVYYTLDGSLPQPPLAHPTDLAWFDDGLPDFAVPGRDSLPWIWTATEPAACSGRHALVSEAGPGVRRHSFELPNGGIRVRAGDGLFIHVCLDARAAPRSLLVEWRAGSWEHRAFWGDRAGWPGTAGQSDLLRRGSLPRAGEWVRLEVPAAELGLEGRRVDGLSLAVLDGGVLWDLAGKSTRTPTASMLYSGRVAVPTNTVLRARAFRTGELPSEVVTASYLIGRQPQVPVVSLALDPEEFTGSVRGIVATGPEASRYTPYYGANFWKPWERRVEFTFIETNGLPVYRSGAGIRIHGGWTRSIPQKSFRLYARRAHGTGCFEHRFFPALTADRFEVLLLRNGGNDWGYAKMRDDLARHCGMALGVDGGESRPAAVFINGAYWGLYSLTERPDEHFICTHHGVDPEAVDTMENGWENCSGDPVAYSALVQDAAKLDLADPASFRSVASRLDLDSLLGYLVTEIHLGNSDWPVHNTLLWRPHRPDGQWRWILTDLDGTFDINGNGVDHPTLAIALGLEPGEVTGALQPTEFLPQMLANTRFKQEFINHFADALNFEFAPAGIIARIVEMEAAMETEIPWHLARWRDSASTDWPLPASVAAWAAEVERLRRFARERPAEMRMQLMEHFELDGEARLTVRVNDPALGRVRVNRLRLPAGSHPWTGVYFRGVPIELEARPEAGCEWVAWQGLQNAPALARVTLAGDLEVEARFGRASNPVAFPTPFELWQGDYRFESLPADTPAGEYPPCMVFLQSMTPDPGLDARFETPWLLPYNLESRSRICGLGARGVSFLNTSNPQDAAGAGYAGAAVLALRTEGVRSISVAWVGGTVTPNERAYALRLQYRIGTVGTFLDLKGTTGQPVGYMRSLVAGDWQRMDPIRLPSEAKGQAVVQLRWVYHRVPAVGESGPRDELRLDDIEVSADRSPVLALRPGSTARDWIVEINGIFFGGAWLQSSADLVLWRNEAEVAGSLDGQATLPWRQGTADRLRFFRLWFP